MRRLNQRLAMLAAAMLLPIAAQAPMAQSLRPAAADATARARVIVKYRADSDMARKQAMTATGLRNLQTRAMSDRIGIALVAGAGIADRMHVVTARGLTSASLAAKLSAQADVEYAVVDERKHIVAVPNDPFYATRPATASSGGPVFGQWYLKPPGAEGTAANTGPAAINAEQAWDVGDGSGRAAVVVAVLDTGLRFDHPDLAANVVPGYDMIAADDSDATGNGGSNFSTANDGNGRDNNPSDPGDWIDATDIANPVLGSACGPASDSSWHGTQTLGLIGATTNNGVGIASVGNGVKVMPVRVLGKCGGFDSDILVGMQWAANVYSDAELATLGLRRTSSPAKVISMSLGSAGSCSQPYRDAIAKILAANTVIVASAGNSEGHAVSTPANCPGVIAVGGLRHAGTKVGFSDLGPEITLGAPGGNCVNTGAGEPCLYPIMTTSNSGLKGPVAGAPGATYTDSFLAPSLGTSFAAPLVSGTVALMFSVKPTLTPTEVRALLQATARPYPTQPGGSSVPVCTAPSASVAQDECYCTTSTCGAGMLDAHAAVVAANGVQAAISLTTTSPAAGQPVTLTSSSVVGPGQSVATYLWAITSTGATGATISGANNASTVTVATTAAGTFTISLTTTDNSGYTSSTTRTVTVAAVTTPPIGGGGGGGGGGALGFGWLAGLLCAVLALAAATRLERRRAARAVSVPARSARRR